MAKNSKEIKPSKATKRWIRNIETDFDVDKIIDVAEPEATEERQRALRLKARVLELITGLSQLTDSLDPSELVWSLETQARASDTPDVTRNSQFTGILGIVIAATKDPEIVELCVESHLGER